MSGDIELQEGIPAIETTCYNKHKHLYSLDQVTDYGEAVCPECHEMFWSTDLTSFARIRKEQK